MSAGSFALFAPAMLLAGVSIAHAQRPPPPIAPFEQPQGVPSASRGTPMPPAPAALSVPDPFAGFRPGPRDLYQSPDGSDRFQHLSRYPAPPPVVLWPGGYYPGPYHPGPYYYPSAYYDMNAPNVPHPKQHREVAARGGLVLQTIPDMAQVYVDGYYVGLAEEFGLRGRAMDISAGAHRIELRAPGYETVTFSVRIEPNGIVRYRGDMQRVATTKPAVVVAAPPQSAVARSFYVIPNCYAGDKPPTGALPKGCDLKNLQTRK